MVGMRVGFDRVQQFHPQFVDDLHVALEGFQHRVDDSAFAGIGINQ